MNISKKVPVIVCIAVVLIHCAVFFDYYKKLETRIDYSEERQFLYAVKLKEDVRVVDTNKVVDAVIFGEEPYDHTDLPAGSVGEIEIFYSHRSHFINDIETETHGFRAYFHQDNKVILAAIKTGPESQLGEDDISYKSIENFEDFISEHNQHVNEAKDAWDKQLSLLKRQLIISVVISAVVFSIIFVIICVIANKFKLPSAVFCIICFFYVVILLATIFL